VSRPFYAYTCISMLAKFRCSRCTISTYVLRYTILYYIRIHLHDLIDLLYFLAKDLIQPVVGFEAYTSSHKTNLLWYANYSAVACRTIQGESARVNIGGVGHIVLIYKIRFSKRKHKLSRLVKGLRIVC
jgi:hypothetical protein